MWMLFSSTCSLCAMQEPLEFNEGDVGLAGGIQVGKNKILCLWLTGTSKTLWVQRFSKNSGLSLFGLSFSPLPGVGAGQRESGHRGHLRCFTGCFMRPSVCEVFYGGLLLSPSVSACCGCFQDPYKHFDTTKGHPKC